MTGDQEGFSQRIDIWWKVQCIQLVTDIFQIQAAYVLGATVRQNLLQVPASLVWITQIYLIRTPGDMTRGMNFRLESYFITLKKRCTRKLPRTS
jgi:hypothetical protein